MSAMHELYSFTLDIWAAPPFGYCEQHCSTHGCADATVIPCLQSFQTEVWWLGNSFSFIWTYYSVFPLQLYQLATPPPLRAQWFSVFSIFLIHPIFPWFWSPHPTCIRWYVTVVLICIPLVVSNVDRRPICLLAICAFLEKKKCTFAHL